MKRAGLLLLFLAVTGSAVPQNSSANFWFLNHTGKTIATLFISPHASQAWGTNVLGRDVLVSGEGFLIVFPTKDNVCVYDFKLQFSDGSGQLYSTGQNLCRSTAIVFNPTENVSLAPGTY